MRLFAQNQGVHENFSAGMQADIPTLKFSHTTKSLGE